MKEKGLYFIGNVRQCHTIFLMALLLNSSNLPESPHLVKPCLPHVIRGTTHFGSRPRHTYFGHRCFCTTGYYIIHWTRSRGCDRLSYRVLGVSSWLGGNMYVGGIEPGKDTPVDVLWIVEGLRDGSLIWTTDGSYDRKRAVDLCGVGWIIFCTNTGF